MYQFSIRLDRTMRDKAKQQQQHRTHPPRGHHRSLGFRFVSVPATPRRSPGGEEQEGLC